MLTRAAGVAVGIAVFIFAGQSAAGEGGELIYSFEGKPELGKFLPGPEIKEDTADLITARTQYGLTARLEKKHATQGEWALVHKITKGHYNMLPQFASGKTPGLVARPPLADFHNPADWYYQRFEQILNDTLARRSGVKPRDWSAYTVLRFDVTSEGAPAVLGMRVHDLNGPSIPARPWGVRTALAIFKVPADKPSTCEFPLAEMARVGEMDLSRIWGINLRVNGYEGEATLYIDNVRLATKDAVAAEDKFPIVKMEGEPRPFARQVPSLPPAKRNVEKMKREAGPVEKIGPVTVYEGTGFYACGFGHFGGSGATYFQNSNWSPVAYDNKRLLVVLKGNSKDARVPPGIKAYGAEGGGMLAFASFDGGKTWGGIKEGDTQPALLPHWYWRAHVCSVPNGDVYIVGTQNCTSYQEGYDIFIRRLTFTGDGWEEDRFAFIDQNIQKCPSLCRVMTLASGRIWAAWTDGFGGSGAKNSDDDGFTWKPCKDASRPVPRPFYEANLEDLSKPVEARPTPPAEVLLWPGTVVPGPLMVTYGDGVAAFSGSGDKWQAHDGKAWGASQKGPFGGDKSHGVVSLALLGRDTLFVARAAHYDNGAKSEPVASLEVARLEGGAWKSDTLEPDGATDVMLTTSGDAVFCFYSKKVADGKYEVRFSRWKGGKWEASELVATETERINHIAAPQACPPNYAAVFWDQWTKESKKSTWVRFAKVPNP
ncbi:MAG: sialidase family protein [Planctomycetota bacterium]